MKRIILFLLMVIVLFNFVACGGGSSGGSNSSDENLEIISIVLDSDNTIITSDNKELVTFQLYGIDASGNYLTIKNVDLYKDGEKYNSTNFKTSTSGTYTFYAKYKEFKSNSITITVNEKAEYKEEKTNIKIESTTQDVLGNIILTNIHTSSSTQKIKNNQSNINFYTENSYKPSLIIAENGSENAVLLGLNHRGETDTELSIRSTAMALVLFDPSILKLSKENYEKAKKYLESSSKLDEIENLVKQNIQNYPDNPLLNDSTYNTELYTKVLSLLNDIREDIESNKKTTVKRSDFSDYKYLGIIDDKNKNEDVYIFNQTYCMYNATVKTGDKLEKQFGDTLFLNRRPLAEIQIINWDENGIVFDPTIKMEETVRIPKLGDVYFGIEYEKLKNQTLYMLAVQVFFDIIGIGEIKLKNEDLQLLMGLFNKHFSGLANTINTLLIEKPANKEKTYEQAYKLLKEAASIGYQPVIEFFKDLAADKAFDYLKDKFSKGYTKFAFKMFLKKITLAATLLYDAVDVGAVLWDIHFAPDKHEILGIQNKGVYPGEAKTIEVEKKWTDNQVLGKDNQISSSYKIKIKAPDAKLISASSRTDNKILLQEVFFAYRAVKGYDAEINVTATSEPKKREWTTLLPKNGYERYKIIREYYEFDVMELKGEIRTPTNFTGFTFDGNVEKTEEKNRFTKTYKVSKDYHYPFGAFAVRKFYTVEYDKGDIDEEGNYIPSLAWKNTHWQYVVDVYHDWIHDIFKNKKSINSWESIDNRYSEKRYFPDNNIEMYRPKNGVINQYIMEK